MDNVSLVGEFVHFLHAEKKWWLAPLMAVMAVFSGALVAAEGSAFAPFIYSIF